MTTDLDALLLVARNVPLTGTDIATIKAALPELIERVRDAEAQRVFYASNDPRDLMLSAARNGKRADAAEARVAELEAAVPKRTHDWLAHCKRLDAERDAVSDDLAKAWKELGATESRVAELESALSKATDNGRLMVLEDRDQYDQTIKQIGEDRATLAARVAHLEAGIEALAEAEASWGDQRMPNGKFRYRAALNGVWLPDALRALLTDKDPQPAPTDIRATIVADIHAITPPTHLTDADQAAYTMGVTAAADIAGGIG